MKIFITGGSGFLGKQVIKRCIRDGHSIAALARSESSAKRVESLGARPVYGDLTSCESYSQSLENCDVVIHCAAPVEFWGPWSKYQLGVIDATMALANECAKKNVRRFIHISSESVLQSAGDLIDINEEHPYPEEPNSFYGKSKKIVEEMLLKIPGKMEIIILRPAFIWGPGCPSFLSISEKVKSKQFVWIDRGQMSFEAVHVENVVEAIRLSLTAGKDRGIYFVTDGESSTVRIFFEDLFEALSLPIPTKSVPGALIRPIAGFVEQLWLLFKISERPPITRFDLAFVAMARKYNIENIKTDLGYRPVINRVDGFAQLSSSQWF